MAAATRIVYLIEWTSLTGRLAVVRSAVNFFSAVGQNDVGALGQVHIRSAVLRLPPCEGELLPYFHRVFIPAELLRELACGAKLGLPPDGLSIRADDLECDQRMRVHHLDFDQRSRDDRNLFVIPSGISVMRPQES